MNLPTCNKYKWFVMYIFSLRYYRRVYSLLNMSEGISTQTEQFMEQLTENRFETAVDRLSPQFREELVEIVPAAGAETTFESPVTALERMWYHLTNKYGQFERIPTQLSKSKRSDGESNSSLNTGVSDCFLSMMMKTVSQQLTSAPTVLRSMPMRMRFLSVNS